ncbi:hypothetical protein, partial [Thiolapillus sp.]|uniref:hypothetical protein n=1 Tax=Thiolapillus sp. TaxID=2017437 RepID=UPI003AF69F2D
MFSLWRKARRENSAASRLLGSTSLRFALHGWQRSNRPIGEEVSRMQQSAYRTSSNGQYEQNSNFISPENIRW